MYTCYSSWMLTYNITPSCMTSYTRPILPLSQYSNFAHYVEVRFYVIVTYILVAHLGISSDPLVLRLILTNDLFLVLVIYLRYFTYIPLFLPSSSYSFFPVMTCTSIFSPGHNTSPGFANNTGFTS